MENVAEPLGSTAGANSGKPVLSDLPSITKDLSSDNKEVVLLAVRAIRKLLSAEQQPPVLQVLEAGALPKLCAFLDTRDNAEIVFEAAWALTNIASTDYTSVVVDGNAIPALVRLLVNENANIREQAAWCLGNIAGDGTNFRDMILKEGALEPLLCNIKEPACLSLLQNTVWTLSNLCRGKPRPDVDIMAPAAALLANLVATHADKTVRDGEECTHVGRKRLQAAN
eukprot:scaffold803_cov310-Pinguiococcus_pyrenoidosus.AAC.109